MAGIGYILPMKLAALSPSTVKKVGEGALGIGVGGAGAYSFGRSMVPKKEEEEKKASFADALIGAPLGAIAAAMAAKKEDKEKAIKRGLLIGALLGFIFGQRTVEAAMARSPEQVLYGERERTSPLESPAIMSLLGGAGIGALSR